MTAKYGLGVAEEVFDAQTEVDGITQEQEKKLGRVLKKMEETVKEKTSRKRKRAGCMMSRTTEVWQTLRHSEDFQAVGEEADTAPLWRLKPIGTRTMAP